jgi:carboxypeptidase family protein
VGARVSLTDQASGEIRVVTSSEAGEFSFSGLGKGTFTVVGESTGFATSKVQNIKLAPRQIQRIDVTLKVRATSGDLVSLPKPLRILYNESDLIVVARIGESKMVRQERDARRIRTTLLLSSILKGKTKGPTVDLYHWSFADLTGPFVAGEEMLLFLKRTITEPAQESPAGYEVGDTQYGIKKVPADELMAYRDRIAELSQIYHGDGEVDVAMVEWLVRCAEDRATSWEGAYDLLERIDRPFDQRANEDGKTELTPSSSENANPLEDVDLQTAARSRDLAALITAEHKARLMTALLQIEELRDRDLPLVTLAQRWKEPGLAAFLIGQLHKFEARPPRLAERVMDIVASELNDEAIASLSRDYQTRVSYLDESGETASEGRAQIVKTAGDEKAAAAIQTRSEMLAEFLRAVEVALAERQLK